jgi:hypothetical protein
VKNKLILVILMLNILSHFAYGKNPANCSQDSNCQEQNSEMKNSSVLRRDKKIKVLEDRTQCIETGTLCTEHCSYSPEGDFDCTESCVPDPHC